MTDLCNRNKIAARERLQSSAMLLILFGTKDRRSVEAGGQFICPKCGVERDYAVISLRQWFTLFFIPVLPTANIEEREILLNAESAKAYTILTC